MTAPLTGGCACGAVRYEIGEPLVGAIYCHCTRCQRRTGTAASANGRTAPGSFQVTQGEDRLKAWRPPGGAEKWFCGDCGSALYSRSIDGEAKIGVRLGTLDSPPKVTPTARQFVAYAVSWEDIPDDGLPRYPESTADSEPIS